MQFSPVVTLLFSSLEICPVYLNHICSESNSQILPHDFFTDITIIINTPLQLAMSLKWLLWVWSWPYREQYSFQKMLILTFVKYFTWMWMTFWSHHSLPASRRYVQKNLIKKNRVALIKANHNVVETVNFSLYFQHNSLWPNTHFNRSEIFCLDQR